MIRAVIVSAALIALSGCRHVHVYERAKLAHPTMTEAVTASPAREHMHGVHEGAIGGGAVAESGCGCN